MLKYQKILINANLNNKKILIKRLTIRKIICI